jgi:hypothetical protein
VDRTTREVGRRTLTPAVVASSLFTVACAAIAITFVAARGGLELPVAPARTQAAIASPATTAAPTGAATLAPTMSVAPTLAPTPGPSLPPTLPPETPAPSAEPTTSADPLAALPGCPDHPGCYEYTVRRGDTLSGVASRYAIPLSTVRALNPELDAAGTIVVGHVIYLGRQPYLRLDRCGGETIDCYLYVVQPGDGLSTIAARFGLTVDAILDANPDIPNANTIYSGQVIRLQYQHAVI